MYEAEVSSTCFIISSVIDHIQYILQSKVLKWLTALFPPSTSHIWSISSHFIQPWPCCVTVISIAPNPVNLCLVSEFIAEQPKYLKIN